MKSGCGVCGRVTDLKEDDGSEFAHPKHQWCACYLLNLVSTVDAAKATANDTDKQKCM